MSDENSEIAVPPQAPNGQLVNGTFTGTPDNQSRVCRAATVYNYVELVYKAFGRTVPTAAKEVALLVLREAKVGGSGDLKQREQAAAGTRPITANQLAGNLAGTGQGTTSATTRTSQTASVTFDDILYMVWTDNEATTKQCVEVFRCTADPGGSGSMPTGRIIEGFHYACKPIAHNRDRYPTAPTHSGGINALRIFNDQATTMIRVARDQKKRYNVYTDFESAQVPPDWKFCKDEAHDGVGINMHFGSGQNIGVSDSKTVGMWSIGCVTLAWGRTHPRYYQDFLRRCVDAPNKNKLPLLVVSTKYVKTYDIWAQEASRGGNATAASTIKREGLEAMPAGYTGYVPSIATKGFCEEVARRAGSLGMGPHPRGQSDANFAHAAGLRAALQNLAITTLAV